MKTIIVTGTPGTGKSTAAKRLVAMHNLYYVDANLLIRKNRLTVGFDRKRKSKIVDTNKLTRILSDTIKSLKKKSQKAKSGKKGIIIDSHLSHYLPKKHVDLCIVTKCDLKNLEKRLQSRGYSEQKVRENLDAEIFDICLIESQKARHNIIILDTTGKISQKVLRRFV